MKKVAVLFAMIILPFSAQASSATIGKIEAAIKRTHSEGKIIKVNGSNVYGVTLADASTVASDLDALEVANQICDLSKNWQLEEDTIVCIAK